MLTPKREKAIAKYIECSNKSEAYRHAFDTSNMANETVHVKACEFFKIDKVKVRVDELRDELQNKSMVTKEDLIKKLLLIANDYEDNKEFTNSASREDIRKAEVLSSLANSSSSISALKQISKMLGFDAPDKLEVTVKSEQPLFKPLD